MKAWSIISAYRDAAPTSLQARDSVRAAASLGDRVGDYDWVRAHITAFADDIHGGQIVTSIGQLNQLLHNLGLLLDTLVDAELQINALKSAFLLRFTPALAALWKKRHLQQTKTGLVLNFRTPAGRPFSIPVKEEHRYLGLVISYHDPIACSIAHRVQAAWTAWGHLRPMLTSASASETVDHLHSCRLDL